MNALSSDWKEQILDHYKRPRSFGEPSPFWAAQEEHNRTCGDHVRVFVGPAPDAGPERARFSFTGAGCSLCIASASIMCELLPAVSPAEARAALEKFQKVWSEGAGDADPGIWQLLSGLRQYPVRSRCVHLPWQALERLLQSPGWPPAAV